MSWIRYNALYAPQTPSIAGTAALSEADDGCAVVSTVALQANGAWTETREGAAIAAAVAVHLSSSSGEDKDDCAAAAHVETHMSGSLPEANDNAALVARVALSCAAALGEGSDRSNGNAHAADPPVIDLNFLISARPCLRRVSPDPRIRAIRARQRVRTVIPARRA